MLQGDGVLTGERGTTVCLSPNGSERKECSNGFSASIRRETMDAPRL